MHLRRRVLAAARQLVGALFPAGTDSTRRLLERLSQLGDATSTSSPSRGASRGASRGGGTPGVGGGGRVAIVALEEALPLFLAAWEEAGALDEQKLRASFTAACPPDGDLSLAAFGALVRQLPRGEGKSDDEVLEMFETAVDLSNALLEEAGSDTIVVEAFVYACKCKGMCVLTAEGAR